MLLVPNEPVIVYDTLTFSFWQNVEVGSAEVVIVWEYRHKHEIVKIKPKKHFMGSSFFKLIKE